MFSTRPSLRPLKRIWPSTLAFSAVLGLSLALPLPEGSKILGLPSPCALYNTLGIPCPACGLTRAFVCCAHGHITEAFGWHPLGPWLFVGMLLYFIWSLWVALSKPPFHVSDFVQFGSLALLGIVMVTFWGLRLSGVFPLPTASPITPSLTQAKMH